VGCFQVVLLEQELEQPWERRSLELVLYPARLLAVRWVRLGGFIAGGALTEPAYTAITGNPDPQLSFWEEFGMGFVIGIPVGVVAGIVGPAGWSLYTGAFWTSTTAYYLGLAAPGATMTVSHWGKPGVGPGSWVMVGRPDWLSWLLAGGPQVGPYSSGLAYQVPIQSVVTPYGGGAPWYEWIKFWQRMII